jgi:hypothetical protein
MGGSTDAADSGTWFLNPEMTALVVDFRLEPSRGLFRIPGERETSKIVALGQDVLRLPK